MKMFSKKTRLAGAVLLTASMVLAGTAWGDTINSNTHWNSSGYTATPGESLAIKDGAIVTVDDSATITVDEDFEIYNGTVTLGKDLSINYIYK